ncbi:hypothetical protein B0A48_18432 [Cryoendolithus antarcticus]|uniref:BTB domain-containing protein n=1 Tax=Cryoendolithus antarcticus TaxID=1507870 RepID=A0A1V8S8U6_9PEZI|nr:hypothetical protein B0A48_18432 [Cryoendolithus antarcticus]
MAEFSIAEPKDEHLNGEREPKRRRSAPAPLDLIAAAPAVPEILIDVSEDGDVLLVVTSGWVMRDTAGFRCSAAALSLASPVFKAILATPIATPLPQPPATNSAFTFASTSPSTEVGKLVPLREPDSDALVVILNIIHFKTIYLPARLAPDKLLRVGTLAAKYQCVDAISRACAPWFDSIYAANLRDDTATMAQAAYHLNDAVFYTRFTNRYILTAPRPMKAIATIQSDDNIAGALRLRHIAAEASLRFDIDLLLELCAVALDKESKHYIDCPPDTDPDPAPVGSDPAAICAVDSQAAPSYLAAMRDAKLWPPSAWAKDEIGDVVQRIRDSRVPDYDDCDKCDFCLPLTEAFDAKLKLVKKLQKDRLWGLCLDCFKAGGLFQGTCRVEHVKVASAGG